MEKIIYTYKKFMVNNSMKTLEKPSYKCKVKTKV